MIVFVVKKIFSRVSNSNRIRVLFYNSLREFSLDVSRIKAIHYDGKAFYVTYETDKIVFYKQKFGNDIVEKPYGKEVKFEVKESNFVCPFCGSLTEVEDWAMYTDEGLTFCWNCKKHVRPIHGRVFVYEIPEVSSEDLANQIAQEKGFKIEKLAVAQGVERAKTLEEVMLPSGIKVEVVEGTLVQYDLHAWMDGVNAIEKELGKVKALRVTIPENLGLSKYYIIKE